MGYTLDIVKLPYLGSKVSRRASYNWPHNPKNLFFFPSLSFLPPSFTYLFFFLLANGHRRRWECYIRSNTYLTTHSKNELVTLCLGSNIRSHQSTANCFSSVVSHTSICLSKINKKKQSWTNRKLDSNNYCCACYGRSRKYIVW